MEEYKKKYIEALERAKKGECLESIFPELKNSKIWEEIIKHLISFNNGCYKKPSEDIIDNWVAWLEKQGEKKSDWSAEDEFMIQDAIHWIKEFQKSNRCKDENDMQNSVTCEDWLKSLKNRIQQPK